MNAGEKKISRILVFQLNWMGDILFSFPFLRALATSFPEAKITCAVASSYVGLLTNNPWVDKVIELPKKKGAVGFVANLAFVMNARKVKYDVCFFLKPSRTKGMMAAASGIKRRIGHSGKNAFLTTSVALPAENVHRSERISSLAGALGVESDDGTYEYFFAPGDEGRAEEILLSSGSRKAKRVALNPGGNWLPKRWPKESFVELGRKLLDKFRDIEIVITGAKKDGSLAEEIVSGIASARCFSVAGRTGMNEAAAVFKKCDLVISADSGPLHLASATGRPTIGLFGPTSPKITGQRGRALNVALHKPLGCDIPCYIAECEKGHKCMWAITVEDVFISAVKVLSRHDSMG